MKRKTRDDDRPDLPYTMKLPDGRTLFVEVPGRMTDVDVSGEVVFKPDGVKFLDRARVMAMKAPAMPTPGYIRTLRDALDLTQTEFGERTGVDKMTVWRWEQGRLTPSDESVKAIEKLRRQVARKGVLLAG
jgi:DNA-binding transcriptional regulator YiaG